MKIPAPQQPLFSLFSPGDSFCRNFFVGVFLFGADLDCRPVTPLFFSSKKRLLSCFCVWGRSLEFGVDGRSVPCAMSQAIVSLPDNRVQSLFFPLPCFFFYWRGQRIQVVPNQPSIKFFGSSPSRKRGKGLWGSANLPSWELSSAFFHPCLGSHSPHWPNENMAMWATPEFPPAGLFLRKAI